MFKSARFIVPLVILLMLTGCRIAWSDESLDTEESHQIAKGNQVIKMDTKLQYSPAS